jgi:hypothetical protein
MAEPLVDMMMKAEEGFSVYDAAAQEMARAFIFHRILLFVAKLLS